MKKHSTAHIIIALVILVGLINIYPTLGWMVRGHLHPPVLNEEGQLLLNEDGEPVDIGRNAEVQKGIDDEKLESPITGFFQRIKFWAMCDRDRVINLGLDLQGGVHMVVSVNIDEEYEEIKDKYSDQWSKADIQAQIQKEALNIISRRINEFEAKEPLITTLGTDKIQVQLAGEKNVDRAAKLVMMTARLTFHITAGAQEMDEALKKVDAHFNNAFVPFLELPYEGYYGVKPDKRTLDHVMKLAKEANETPGLLPEGRMFAFSQPPKSWDANQNYTIYLLDKEPGADGTGLAMAQARMDDERPGSYQIVFQFKGEGAERFAELTGNNIKKRMAIVVDGVVCSSPATIQERISGYGNITGGFTGDEATNLAIALNSGSMPVEVKLELSNVVGATLGKDSVEKGVYSAIAGIIFVVCFMVYYYRFAGLVANVALVLNALLVLGALAYFKGTLTLPGIAGLILTVGMAVDANVLIFERIREEIRNGRSLLAAIDSGYQKATITILDANVTTLIAAAVLWQFGTGPIEGFATTLSIGVCSSVFTALVVTRAIFNFMAERKLLTNLSMAQWVGAETKYEFLGRRKYAFALSALVIIGGLVVFGGRLGAGTMLGVDFSEGTTMTVALQGGAEVDVGDVRKQLTDAGFESPSVQDYGTRGNEFTMRLAETPDVRTEEGGSATIVGRVQEALGSLCGGAENVNTLSVEAVGAVVGQQLRSDAWAAIVYALVFIVAYLWFRFELKFAVGAVVALAHDVLITIGIFAICGREISMPVVAALLTIIGYSLNDTIVVFDRIREDLRVYRGRGMSYLEIMNVSINQTLSRTILTSFTTLLVVAMLCVFGGDVIFDFALALLIGVIVGTYSSIFVASPVVYLWQTIAANRREAKGPGRADKKKKKADATV